MPLSGIRAIHAMPLMMLDQTNACLFDNLVGDKKRDGSEQTSNDGANKRITLHRQKSFALEPGPQSGFGHYQAQEIRTVAWLKSTTIF